VRYNIPPSLVRAYRGEDIVVRSRDSSDFPKSLSEADVKKVKYLQLLSLSGDTDWLARWGEKIPLDLVMTEPEKEFPLLYRFSRLLNKHPVRVSVPPVPGFSKAVKLAASLSFAVKIIGGQPGPALNGEMTEVLNLYLRHPTVSQPIEYFHSLLLAFFHERPVSLPTIQEEDPMYFRYITDQGQETISERFAAQGMIGESAIGLLTRQLPEAGEECSGCEFLPHCRGYFKWPERDYSCEGAKRMLGALKNAAHELKTDYASSLERTGENKT